MARGQRNGGRSTRRPVGIGALLLLGLVVPPVPAQQQTVGLFVNDNPDSGYTLFSPLGSETSYLINNDGLLVRSWTGTQRPGQVAYFTAAGTLMRTSKLAGSPPPGFPVFLGSGGRFEEYDWDGNLVWEYEYVSNEHLAHHDIHLMPNGNILALGWDLVSEAEAVAEGKDPADVTDELLVDSIVELQPLPPSGANIVWEWHARDHLIQDFDPAKTNFGVVADHPERIDFNFNNRYDFVHINSVDYHPALDQIVLSAHSFDEIWIIDHSTTTAEAAGHTGGSSGMGGDLLYRWGNPQAYRVGGGGDQKLFNQHDAQWIDPGLPGAGNLLVFNNQNPGAGGNFSSVEEIVPPVDGNGNYPLVPGQAWGPASALWTYQANPPESYYSAGNSGAQRLPNGNTVTTLASSGRFIEVEPDGTVTWEYQNPESGPGLLNQGDPVSNVSVAKVRRYPPAYPGLAGKDLTPGDPVEGITRPAPASAGSLRADRLSADGSQLDVSWSDGGCPSFEYHLLFGDLANVAAASIDGAECDIGTSGSALWNNVPAASQFFLVVGTDITGVYESDWGYVSDGNARGATKASFRCGTTTKILDPQCP